MEHSYRRPVLEPHRIFADDPMTSLPGGNPSLFDSVMPFTRIWGSEESSGLEPASVDSACGMAWDWK